MTDWMNATGNKLVVILDNYESLTGATTLATTEQLKRDLWLRGDEGLIFMMPDTLWTIAGRNKLRWDGELADELEQHLITALSPDDSNWFLEKAGVVDENLRDGLVKLTGGYPIFLDLCVDVYTEYKRQHDNAEPTIDEFGSKREEVVGRIFRYLDAAGDDAAKDMLEFLCVLNVWTDEFAVDIGGTALHNFSRNTYKRVKNFSFIQSERVENENLDLTIFRFDKTIQNLLISTCDEKLIADVTSAVDEHFNNFFTGKKTFDAKEIFYLKLWANFIVRFDDDADKISEHYKATLNYYVDALTDYAVFDAAEEILQLFMNKIESLDATDTAAYAYFEQKLSWLKRAQGNYDESRKLANSAYEKYCRLLGDEHPDTLSAMNNLAFSLSKLGRYDETLTLQEQVSSLRKKILGDEHPDTLSAMNNLAVSLSNLGRYDEALTLREQVLELRKKILGDEHPDTLFAMKILSGSLSNLGRYDEAFALREQVLALYKKTLGDEHPYTLSAMKILSGSLSDLGRY
ncbi:MAG: tetratricopeptide repeat-containing protein, partial [Selenomonadaceae bacterium]|nr:tetratricopeptide repeat-containing protein [Selenomonadaceae bacterium]